MTDPNKVAMLDDCGRMPALECLRIIWLANLNVAVVNKDKGITCARPPH